MGYSKKLYNVLGGYAYYSTIRPKTRKDQYFTNLSKTAICFCALFTITIQPEYPQEFHGLQTMPQILPFLSFPSQ